MHSSRFPEFKPGLEAFAALWSGDPIRALALAHNVDRPGYAALRALAWFRSAQDDRALREHGRRHLSHYDAYEAMWLASVAAEILVSRGECNRARDVLAPIVALARRQNAPSLVAFGLAADASCALGNGDPLRAASLLGDATRMLANVSEQPFAGPHAVGIATARCRIAAARARLHAELGDLRAQEAALIEAASLAGDPAHPDRALEAQALLALTAIVSGSPTDAPRRLVLERARTFPWSPHTDSVRTSIRRSLRNSARLFGFPYDASGILGGTTAPSLPLRLAECLDALRFDRWSDAAEYLADARFCVELALDVDWAAEAAESQAELAVLASVIAPFDVAVAWRVRRMVHVERARCDVALADGALAKADGNLREAVELLAGAAARGNAPHLAAIAGIERFTITRLPGDLRPAREFADAYPAAPFAHRLARAIGDAECAAPGDFPYLGSCAGAVVPADQTA